MTEAAVRDWSEHDRILRGDRLARPAYPLGGTDRTDGRRDPAPEWDEWYAGFSLTERRQLLPFMASVGQRGLAPDELAGELGCSIPEALRQWARACQLARPARAVDEWSEWAEADALAASDAELLGPEELAQRWRISVPALHQRLSRTRRGIGAATTPTPDMVISRVPIWTGETVRVWEEEHA